MEGWKTVVLSDETRINRLGSGGRIWGWKKAGEGLSDRLVKETAKSRGGSLMMWGYMLWESVRYVCKIDGWMGSFILRFWRMSFRKALHFMAKTSLVSSFSKTMIQSISARGPLLNLKSMDLRFFHCQLSLKILIPLSICGITSKKG